MRQALESLSVQERGILVINTPYGKKCEEMMLRTVYIQLLASQKLVGLADREDSASSMVERMMELCYDDKHFLTVQLYSKSELSQIHGCDPDTILSKRMLVVPTLDGRYYLLHTGIAGAICRAAGLLPT
jgi:hypothetical protein